MGTHCLTIFEGYHGHRLATVYRSMDGYPECHGRELADLLVGYRLVNGITRADRQQWENGLRVANGFQDLAGQVLAGLFTNTPDKRPLLGSFYLVGNSETEAEYVYIVRHDPVKGLELEVRRDSPRGQLLYLGRPALFDPNQVPNDNEGDWQPPTAEPRILMLVASSQDGNPPHRIRRGKDGVICCDCQGWKLHKSCRHLDIYNAAMSQDEGGDK